MAKICEVSERKQVAATAESVWQKICEPCSIRQWNSRIADCETFENDQGQIVRNYVLASETAEAPTMVETELLRSNDIMTIT